MSERGRGFSEMQPHPETPRSETPESASEGEPLLAHLEMYRLPGDPPLTAKDVARYTKSMEHITDGVAEFVRKDLATEEDAITQENFVSLRLLGIMDDGDRRGSAAELSVFLDRASRSKNKYVRMDAIEYAAFLDDADHVAILQRGLTDEESVDVRLHAVQRIGLVPEADRAKLVLQAMTDDESSMVRWRGVEWIGHVPEAERAALLVRALSDKDQSIRWSAAGWIDLVPEAEQRAIFEQYPVFFPEIEMPGEHSEVAEESKDEGAEDELAVADADEVARLLDSKDEEDFMYAMELLPDAPEKDRARLLVKAFRHGNVYVRLDASRRIDIAPVQERAALIAIALEDSDQDVRRNAMSELGTLSSEEERRGLLDKLDAADRERLQDAARGSGRLYKDQPERFFAKEFDKTGSSTTLLDTVPGDAENSLKHRVILRHIEPTPFVSWRMAFEAAGVWKGKGFDYVPIEPIVKADRNGATIDVATRVLRGPTVAEWKTETHGIYAAQVDKMMNDIKDVLEELGIEHGHPHVSNFMVVFERDAEDKPILERTPRVYAIDFDAAKSPGPA